MRAPMQGSRGRATGDTQGESTSTTESVTYRDLVVVQQQLLEMPEVLESIGRNPRDAVAHQKNLPSVLRDVLGRERIQTRLLT